MDSLFCERISATKMSSGNPPMWVVLGSIEFVILFVFTILLVRFYASKDSPLYANVIVVISWYLGFFGILFLPIDIAEAYYSIYYVTSNSSDASNGGAFPNIDVGRNGSSSISFTPSYTPSFTYTALPTLSVAASKSPLVSTSWAISASPTLSRLSSATSSISFSATRTPTPTPSQSMGSIPSASSSPTQTKSASFSPSVTPTKTPTISLTPTRSKIPATHTPSQTPFPACFPNCAGGSGNIGGRRRALRDTQYALNEGDGEDEKGYSLLLKSSRTSSRLLGDVAVTIKPTANATTYPFNGNNSSNTRPGGDNLITEKTLQIRNTQLEGFWVWVYWLTFFNTYILIPMVQEYVAAGEFTKLARVYAAFKINIIFYAVCGVFAFAALAYVVVGLNQGISDMMPVLISLSNTMGLLIIILLIGYGTAEVPRSFWIESDPDLDLRRNYFFAPELDSQLFDARSVLTDLLKKLKAFESKVTAMAADKSLAEKQPRVAQTVPELQRCLAIVTRKANFAQTLPGIKAPKKETPEQARRRIALEKKLADETADDEAENKANPNGSWFASIGLGGNDKYAGVTLHALAKLHKKLMVEIGNLQKTQFLMDQMVVRCMMLEYIVAKVPPPVPVKKKTADGKTFYLTPKGSGISGAISPQFAQLQRSGAGNTNKGKGGGKDHHNTNNFSSKELTVPKTTLNGIPVSDSETDVLSERTGEALLSMLVLPNWFNGEINRAVWTFRMHAVPYVYKVLWLLCEIMSLLLIWSEATIFLNLSGLVPVNLSIFGWFLHWADETGSHSYTTIQLAALVPLAYMCWCSTYTVFSLKLFGMMELYGNQNTDPYSMLVCASLFNRLQFSLAFNYLNVLMHSSNRADYPPTAFLNSVGAKMALSVIDWYLPIGIAVIYITCKLSVFNRVLTMLGMEAHGEPITGNTEHEGIIRTGMGIVSKGKRTLGLSVTPDGMSDDDFEKADEASRDRLRAIMLRAQARKEGKNPDDVARLDGGGGSTTTSSAEYSSGGYVGRIEGMSLSSFNSTGGGNSDDINGGMDGSASSSSGNGGGPKGPPVKMGLAALASRAASNLAKNVGLPTANSSKNAQESSGNLDYGSDDISSSKSPRAEMDSWRKDNRPYNSNSSIDFSSSHLPIATVVVPPEPPTMAELLKGKRRL